MTTRTSADDAWLVKQIACGNRQALSELYTRHQHSLFSYLLQLTPDYGLAEELLQDTLVAVWKSARNFEGRSTVLTWLIGIARRQAHNTLRQRKIPLTDISELEHLPAPELEPEERILANAVRDELTRAFHQLAPVHREVLLLIFVQELSYQEAADVLEIPVGTVKSRLSNARRALRALLDAKEDTRK
ncbi:MAG TPA: sigma-70 family RNA polymerase sigma factor [Ktedonobacteraceae bacterium]|nr:sigma-70 family RNA polymerase sigma factor [Ktedonobacteraceae bacterium]